MDSPPKLGITRRQGLAAIGATAAAAASCAPEPDARPASGSDASGARAGRGSSDRMPVVFVPHGGGPWPFVDVPLGDKAELDALATYLRSVKSRPLVAPKALLVISAHWEESAPTVTSSEAPPLFFDYYGFPPESYELTWPAPGDPALAARVRKLLDGAGFASRENAERGYDHGTFVPLKLTYPDAEVPVVQLSLKAGLDPAEHLAMGRALAPLRDEGVFIVGSGMSYHNMRGFGSRGRPASEAFDAWLSATVTLGPAARDERLKAWASAPLARQAHPREEHLLPLMVIAGAAAEDPGRVAYGGTIMGVRISGYDFG